MQDDEDTIETLKNSDKQNAKISMDKKILDLMQDLMVSHTEIYKKFVDDPNFKRHYLEFIFDIVWQKTKNPNIGERPSL